MRFFVMGFCATIQNFQVTEMLQLITVSLSFLKIFITLFCKISNFFIFVSFKYAKNNIFFTFNRKL